MGSSSRARGNKLLFAMQVSEVLDFDTYYNDSRFAPKKPNKNGPWPHSCGDNMYYRADAERWQQHPSIYHILPAERAKDVKYPRVFIAERFYYFGKEAVELPDAYRGLVWERQGCKCKHDFDVVRQFLVWLQDNFEPGIHGEPFDKPKQIGVPIKLVF